MGYVGSAPPSTQPAVMKPQGQTGLSKPPGLWTLVSRGGHKHPVLEVQPRQTTQAARSVPKVFGRGCGMPTEGLGPGPSGAREREPVTPCSSIRPQALTRSSGVCGSQTQGPDRQMRGAELQPPEPGWGTFQHRGGSPTCGMEVSSLQKHSHFHGTHT